MGNSTVYDAFVQQAENRAQQPLLAVPSLAGRDYYPDGIEFTTAKSNSTSTH